MKEALKLALEALEQSQQILDEYMTECVTARQANNEAIKTIKEAMAQPEQEPVGEAYLCDHCHTPFDGAFQCPSCGHGRATKEPVYTTPPQHSANARKPLTDEQVAEIYTNTKGLDFYLNFARAVEAAHGIR